MAAIVDGSMPLTGGTVGVEVVNGLASF